jgi:hypothetical protein
MSSSVTENVTWFMFKAALSIIATFIVTSVIIIMIIYSALCCLMQAGPWLKAHYIEHCHNENGC